MSFYWALCISQFFDVKRKDFWEMFIHHVTTIALMGFSWTCNLTRVGTLVLVIHNCANIFLEVIVYFSGRVGYGPYLDRGFWVSLGAKLFRVFAQSSLMGFSLTCNLTRVGTLVLVIHDCADIF